MITSLVALFKLTLTLFVAALGVMATTIDGGVGTEPVTGRALMSEPKADHQPEIAPASVSADITDVDELLRALETAGAEVELMSAKINYTKLFAIQGDTQTRRGKLAFESRDGDDGLPLRRFGITFDHLIVGRRVENIDTGFTERYIFDGEWLAEVFPGDKQFIRRQVVAPGERWDPLRLGEGPFPIPIQQRRDDILRRYDASLMPATDGLDHPDHLRVAGECYQLMLTPREDAGESDLREIRVWYDKATLLPQIARTINRRHDESYILLSGVKTNGDAEIAAEELSTAPPEDLENWNYSEEPFRD